MNTKHRNPVPIGTVVHDLHGQPWVYLGYKEPGPRTPGADKHNFVMAHPKPKGVFDPELKLARRSTIVRYFPELEKVWP